MPGSFAGELKLQRLSVTGSLRESGFLYFPIVHTIDRNNETQVSGSEYDSGVQHLFKLKPPLAPKLSENNVEKACVDILRWRHWYVARLHSGRVKTLDNRRILTLCEAGTPDYLCAHAEHPPFFLETKRERGKRTLVQEARHFEIEKTYKIPTITVDKVEDLLDYLRKIDEVAEDKA